MSAPEPCSTPRLALACALCGGRNDCAVAASGTFAAPCWCRDVTFTPDLLARVPEALRGQACLCRACAGAAPASTTP